MAGWRYNQINNFFNKLEPQIGTLDSLTTFEAICVRRAEPQHMLSRMYKLILSGQKNTTPYFIKEWEKELGHIFTTCTKK